MLRSSSQPRLCAMVGALALLFGAGAAHAQYSWIGENGTRHFSDRPPPPGTPAHKILKAPGRALPPAPSPALPPLPQAQPSVVVAAPAAAPDGTGVPVQAGAGPSPLARQEAAYRERVRLHGEQEKKEAADAQRRRELAERCEAARQLKAQSESGLRVARIDANGERVYLTDEEKAADAARAGKVLAACR